MFDSFAYFNTFLGFAEDGGTLYPSRGACSIIDKPRSTSPSLANSFVKFNYLGLWLSIVGYLIPVWVLAVVYYK